MRSFSEAHGVAAAEFGVEWHTTLAEQHRMLAQLLRPQLGVRRSRQLAEALIGRFGSIPQALAAPPILLMEIEGIGKRVADHLHSTHEFAKALAGMKLQDRTAIHSWTDLLTYCRLKIGFENVEHLRILFLDKKNRLIADELQQRGTVDHTPCYPREIVRRSLELSATAVVLYHNHPSGDPSPSPGDVLATKDLGAALRTVGITLHDHVVVGQNGVCSLRQMKLIPEAFRLVP